MVRLENVTRIYRRRRGIVKGLDGVSLEVQRGEFLVIRGPSGCGKTTLLLSVGGMLHPTSGRVVLDGQDLYALGSGERARIRAGKIGFIFQMFHLVPYLSVLENALLARGRGGLRVDAARARDLLARLGLEDRLDHTPEELSAGERQRAAIARALMNRPGLILADEPTGNLDPENSKVVLGHLREFQRNGGTVILVTHGSAADAHATRTVEMRAGRLTG